MSQDYSRSGTLRVSLATITPPHIEVPSSSELKHTEDKSDESTTPNEDLSAAPTTATGISPIELPALLDEAVPFGHICLSHMDSSCQGIAEWDVVRLKITSPLSALPPTINGDISGDSEPQCDHPLIENKANEAEHRRLPGMDKVITKGLAFLYTSFVFQSGMFFPGSSRGSFREYRLSSVIRSLTML